MVPFLLYFVSNVNFPKSIPSIIYQAMQCGAIMLKCFSKNVKKNIEIQIILFCLQGYTNENN